MGYEIVNSGNPLTWEDFEKIAIEDIDEVRRQRQATVNPAEYSDWIYRGHASKDWSLETTLERFLQDDLGTPCTQYSVEEYYRYLAAIVPAVNSLTTQKFRRVAAHELDFDRARKLPLYKFLCYTRHHGFPTPLLDWTASYYVAAFFAFRSARANADPAIFAYKEWNGDVRGGWVSQPIIDEHGPYVETHARHYKQQSRYTACRAEIDDKVFFMNHQKAAEEDPDNHMIKKFVLRSGEKAKVLERLFRMNINDYTLFGDEESLMRMLAYKEFHDL